MSRIYNPPYSWERLSLESFTEMLSSESCLKSLFLKEILNYYLGKNFINNHSRKIFLNELQLIVEKSIEAVITQGTINTIASHLSNLSVESEHHYLTNILQILKEFYISSDINQQDWLEENGIPIKSSNIHYQDFLGKLYNLISLFSPGNVNSVENFNEISRIHFFQPEKTLFTKEIFLNRLKNHLLMLKKDYVSSNNKFSIICNTLTQLIINQVAQQFTMEQNNVQRPITYRSL